MLTYFRGPPTGRAALPDTLHDVREGRVAPSTAARALLDLFEH
jgi:LAO/AO transport system kinase